MNLATVIERSRRDHESWKYTSLKPLEGLKCVCARAPALKKPPALPSIVSAAGERHQIIFLNGVWQQQLSKLGELDGIMQGSPEKGYALKLAGQTCLVTAPVELVFLGEGDTQAIEFNLRLSIDLGANGRLTLIEHHMRPAGAQAIVGVYETDIRLGQQAKLVHARIIDGNAQFSYLGRTHVKIEEGGFYDNFAFIKGGRLVRNEIETELAGTMAQCALNGVMLLRGSEHADTTTHIIHAAPHGSSQEFYKSVVAGKARGVFQGKVTVAQAAQKTDAKQLNRALLLSDQAEMDAKPELRIFADDVKCSHGAAIGELDPDALFYLRARGLGEHMARALLIRGFVGEIIDDIHMQELRDYCHAQAGKWLDEQD